MESTKYIGRVGALAVALGIGTALPSGTGIAWADETGGNAGKTSTSSNDKSGASSGGNAGNGSAGSSPNVKKPDASTTPSRKGPLSKLSERVRKDVESGLDGVGDALKRTQTRFDETRTQLSGTATKPARSRSSQNTGKSEPTKSSWSTQPSRDAAATVPDLDRTEQDLTQRPSTIVVKIKAATADIAQRGRDTNSTLRTPITALGTPDTMQQISAVPAAMITAPEPTTAKVTAPPVVSALLSAAGLAPFGAGTSPVAPAQSPALWAVMAWARREFERSVNPNGARVVSANDAASTVAEGEIQPMAAVVTDPAAATDPNKLTPKPAAPKVGQTTSIGWVTGNGTAPWVVGGTDLGIMWDNGAGKILSIFGDTFNDKAMTTGWRNNVLFRTGDTNLSNGLQFDEAVVTPGGTGPGTNYPANTWWGPGAGYQNGLGAGPIGAAQVILANPKFNGLFGTTYTMIPTSGISVTDPATNQTTQYVTVMSVRTWDNPGSWTTNYSAIAYSTDGGEHWTVDPNTVRASGFLRANKGFVAGNQNFQQNALVYGDAENPNSWTGGAVGSGERYVYVYGTPSGRQGSAYVARVPESELRNLDDYEYWAGEDNGGWRKGDPSAATSVIGGGNSNYLSFLPKTGFLGQINKEIANFINGIWVGGLPTGGNVSEMSVQYNEYLGKYVVLYTDGGNNVVMRVSDSPQGEWSDATVLVANAPASTDPVLNTAQSGMYAPMIHPWSGTDKLGTGNEQYLYYNLSYWGNYNVALKQTDLAPLKAQYTQNV
ncbi:hypothetical protein M2272_001587 [Mycobacterium frederiksbergense]|uniref:DUF4185 domain-containing protein n=1 Tax=Mycolicibacterium frederiksbergense TaxID=117567 RepID=A0ABT6KWF7_9MYCO|nr:DUF4185 domain-containing protein [Mycolicibacterium frederiksbergense]MDH6194958.1 hypothetical protein [Mycolicibacterium frederiksbergense]